MLACWDGSDLRVQLLAVLLASCWPQRSMPRAALYPLVCVTPALLLGKRKQWQVVMPLIAAAGLHRCARWCSVR